MLEELRNIIGIEGLDRQSGLEARKKALENWIERHIAEITIENSIIKANLTPTENDFLVYHMGYQIAEKILEDHALVVRESNKIRVKVLVLNKDYPKNKE